MIHATYKVIFPIPTEDQIASIYNNDRAINLNIKDIFVHAPTGKIVDPLRRAQDLVELYSWCMENLKDSYELDIYNSCLETDSKENVTKIKLTYDCEVKSRVVSISTL